MLPEEVHGLSIGPMEDHQQGGAGDDRHHWMKWK
jgi:hypothetical protein